MEFNAFILKSKWLGSNLKHLNLFGDKTGRIDVVVRIKKGEFPLKYETFSLSHFIGLNVGDKLKVRDCELIESNIPETLERLSYLSKISRFYLSYAFSENEKLFSLLKHYIKVKESFDLAIAMFVVKFSFFEGIFPVVLRCANCGSSRLSSFSLKEGGAICEKCGKGEFRWNRELGVLSMSFLKKPFNVLKLSRYRGRDLSLIQTVFKNHLDFRLGKDERNI